MKKIKIDPCAQVNTIPLSHYRKLFPTSSKLATKTKEPYNLQTTPESVKMVTLFLFLTKFVIDVCHTFQPVTYPTHFYVFKDATSPLILLSHAASDWLGILKFKEPNEAAATLLSHSIQQNNQANHLQYTHWYRTITYCQHAHTEQQSVKTTQASIKDHPFTGP